MTGSIITSEYRESVILKQGSGKKEAVLNQLSCHSEERSDKGISLFELLYNEIALLRSQ
jgi:hypothetical protein